jgi:alanine racemase
MSRPIRAASTGPRCATITAWCAAPRRRRPRSGAWSRPMPTGMACWRRRRLWPSATDGFALVELEGAMALRDAGIRQPILMLEGPYQADELPLFAELRTDSGAAHDVAGRGADRRPPAARVAGLSEAQHRHEPPGFDADEFAAALDRLVVADCLGIRHADDAFCRCRRSARHRRQMQRFRANRRPRTLPVSLANSAALLRFPEAMATGCGRASCSMAHRRFPPCRARNRARPAPGDDAGKRTDRGARSGAGDRVGYGGSFVAEQPMRVGIVACGYADGYPRHAPTGTPVLVAGDARARWGASRWTRSASI